MRTKREEMEDPNSCWNKAKYDEPMFILLGRDESAPAAIENWCDRRVRTSKNLTDDVQIKEAMGLAEVMRDYRINHD